MYTTYLHYILNIIFQNPIWHEFQVALLQRDLTPKRQWHQIVVFGVFGQTTIVA
jgi:hypothetical protein